MSHCEEIAYITEARKDQSSEVAAEEDRRAEEGREYIDRKNLALVG